MLLGGRKSDVCKMCLVFLCPILIISPSNSPSSPAVLGNLWDVTDKDIDRYTKALLENLPIDGPSLQKHVTVTRSTCDLPYLTGSSPIIYGLPIYFQL